MKNFNTKEISLFINHQPEIRSILTKFGVEFDLNELVDQFSDFKILEIGGPFSTAKKIMKKSTGEIFKEGDIVFHPKYEKEIGPIWFDGALTGEKIFSKYYSGYVRASSGLYHLSEIKSIKSVKSEEIEILL